MTTPHHDDSDATDDDASDFVPLGVAARLVGRSYSWAWDHAAAGLLGGRRIGARGRWHVRRSSLARVAPKHPGASRRRFERPWLRLAVNNVGAERETTR